MSDLGTTLAVWLLVNVNGVPSSPIIFALLMEAKLSPETLVLTQTTRRNIPEGCIQDDEASNGRVDSRGYEVIWKEVIVGWTKHNPHVRLQEMKKSADRR
jgi:hypothetical protein